MTEVTDTRDSNAERITKPLARIENGNPYKTQTLSDLSNEQRRIAEEAILQKLKADLAIHQAAQPLRLEEARGFFQTLSAEQVGVPEQLLYLSSSEDPFTKKPFITMEERLAAAREFANKEKYFDPDTGVPLSPGGYAERLLIDKILAQAPETRSSLNDVYISYLSIKHDLEPKQVLRMLQGKELNFITAGQITPDVSKFFKAGMFAQDEDPKANLWQYKEGRRVNIPDAEGHMQSYEIARKQSNGLTYELQLPTGSLVEVSKGYIDQYNKPTFGEKVRTVGEVAGSVVGKAAHELHMTAVMVAQAGGIHPAWVNGRPVWVAEPWADIKMDSRQQEGSNYFGEDNMYVKKYREQFGDKKVIDPEADGGDIPHVRVHGLELQYLDHHRINAARQLKKPIVFQPSSAETYA